MAIFDEEMVSVLMPVFNVRDYIVEAIDSVLGQKGVKFEVIVVDDFSTDGTYELIANRYGLIPEIKLVKNNKKGKNEALNYAYSLAKGGTIVLFAGDDILAENSLFLRKIDDCKERKVKTGKILSFSADSKHDGILFPKSDTPNLSGGAAAFSRSAADIIFPIPVSLPNEDGWSKLHFEFFEHDVSWTNDVVLFYRIHERNSMAFGAGFEKRSQAIASRNEVYDIFYNKYERILSGKAKAAVIAKSRLEKYRQEGDLLRILFCANVSLKERVSCVLYSNRLLYAVRVYLNKLLSGR